ncbi:hypothetical protein OQA88_4580 [Cercophora sp. LCS_1]
MRFTLSLAVWASLSTCGTSKAFRRSDFPQQTSPPQVFQFAAAPEPTAAPQADLVKRQTTLVGLDTCGYINGIISEASAITCHNTNARCVPDTQSSIMGCCDNTSEVNCGFYSTCMDSTMVTGTPSGDYYRTLWCTAGSNTMCRMGLYTDSYFKSYRIYWCHSQPTTFSMSYSPPQTVVATTSTPVPTSPTTPSMSVTTVVLTPTAQASDPVPAGAIAGGVVGGIAAIGLIALAFFIVIRRGRKREPENPPAVTSPAMYYAATTQYPPSGYEQGSVGKPGSYYPGPSPVGTSPPPHAYMQPVHEVYTQPTSELSADRGATELR